MSPRIKTIRKVLNPPKIKGFKPYGPETGDEKMEPINLLFEEYEALRLCDYDFCNHHQASVMMGVSRPTFTRIYASALQKIAKAFVEGRQIAIEGGKVYFDSDWYQCLKCSCYFNNPEKDKKIECCPLCGNQEVIHLDYAYSNEYQTDTTNDNIVVCADCAYEEMNPTDQQDNLQVCPICNGIMRRKNSAFCRNN